jgi:hypothetical protein
MHINQQGQQIQVTALELHCEHHDSLRRSGGRDILPPPPPVSS